VTSVRICLVRHGQAGGPIEPAETWDPPLTPVGFEQAKRLAEWLAASPRLDVGERLSIASLWASPLQRAQSTAAYGAAALGLPIVTSETLREAAFHVSDHLPEMTAPLAACADYEPSVLYVNFRAQAAGALRALIAQAGVSRGTVLAVTHGGVIKTILRLVAGSEALSFRLYHTGLNVIEWREYRWRLLCLNAWDHLPPELRTA
jgi:broad specificity phosphatase PhoE